MSSRKIKLLAGNDSDGFEQLVRIYSESIVAAEQKAISQLRDMSQQDKYKFYIVEQGGKIEGFAIYCNMFNINCSLLEYMAVANRCRGMGVGTDLFNSSVAMQCVDVQYILMEVDSEIADPSKDNIRRKKFYRNLSCKQFEGLAYIMPSLDKTLPPPMNLMIYTDIIPTFLDKHILSDWLANIYADVYGMPANDARIDLMLENLGERIDLI